jgi:hypothetical protein
MSNLIGKKVTVRKEATRFWEVCSSVTPELSYLIITDVDPDNDYHWDAYNKEGKKIDNCFGHGLTEADFIPLTRTIDDVQEGDVITNGHHFREVLCTSLNGKVVWITDYWKKGQDKNTSYSSGYTKQQLKERGYTLVQDTPETIEVSGKKYDKKQVEERLAELKPVE